MEHTSIHDKNHTNHTDGRGERKNIECSTSCSNIATSDNTCTDGTGKATADANPDHKSCKTRKEDIEVCKCFRKAPEKEDQFANPKRKLVVLAFASILILIASIATWYGLSSTDTKEHSSLGLMTDGDGGPIPVIFSGQLIGGPMVENTHSNSSGLVSSWSLDDYESEKAEMGLTQELRFLIDSLSPIVSQISEREGTHLSDFLASRRNDETIVFKGSPQHNALVWLSHAIVCQETESTEITSNSTTSRNGQCVSLLSRAQLLNRYALSTMYFAWNGKSWENAQGWLSYGDSGIGCDTQLQALARSSKNYDSIANGDIEPQKWPSDVCLWKGVTCRHKIQSNGNNDLNSTTTSYRFQNESDHSSLRAKAEEDIIGLDLSGNNLVGYMGDVKELRLLESMEVLNLSQNHLEGFVPREVGMLQELQYLDLSQNFLLGNLPSLIPKNLIKLEVVKLQGNFLVGGLEDFQCTNREDWKEFSADCYGERPRLGCPCCTICCGSTDTSSSSSSNLRGALQVLGEEQEQQETNEKNSTTKKNEGNETIMCRERVPED